jgi:hypothetical protein
MNKLALAVKPFNLNPPSFTSSIEGLKPKFISKDDQLNWFQDAIDDPFKAHCICISSEPNDRIAKAAAAYLMQNAYDKAENRLPLWHDIMGNFENKLLRDDISQPSMLILSNVLPNSTAVKFEKLRDILETYPDIPRIVVTSGMDPFMFFSRHLYYPLTGCIYLKTGLVKSEVEI